MSRNIIVYPGTFDPITLGHMDVIKRGLKLFDHLIVAVADNLAKKTLFSVEERVSLIEGAVRGTDHVSVESFDGLLVNYVKEKGGNAVLRGLRFVSDFEYEFQMALTNRKLSPDIETIFMMTAEPYSYVSSRFIKEVARLRGEVKSFVPENVSKKLEKVFNKL